MGILTDLKCEKCGRAFIEGQKVVEMGIDKGEVDSEENIIYDLYPYEQEFYHENCWAKLQKHTGNVKEKN